MRAGFKIKLAIFIFLSIILFQATLTLSFAEEGKIVSSEVQYRESVKRVMDGYLAPDQYVIVLHPKDNEKTLSNKEIELQIIVKESLEENRFELISKALETDLGRNSAAKIRWSLVKGKELSSDLDSTLEIGSEWFNWKRIALIIFGALMLITNLLFRKRNNEPLETHVETHVETHGGPSVIPEVTVEVSDQVPVNSSSEPNDYVNYLSASREEEVLQALFNHHPAEAETLRRSRVIFQDILFYPTELTRAALAALDPLVVIGALRGYDPEFAAEFLQLLSPDLRTRILGQFEKPDLPAPELEGPDCRRSICQSISEHFKSQNFQISAHWIP